MSRDDVTVTVRNSGKVEVNGALVAEVVIGEVISQDALAESLTLHRISHIILETVQGVIEALGEGAAERAKATHYGRNGYVGALTSKERLSVSEGLADGLLDVTIPHPLNITEFGLELGIPPMPRRSDHAYLEGYALGRRLRVLTRSLSTTVRSASQPPETPQSGRPS